jgi:hypothetical protein
MDHSSNDGPFKIVRTNWSVCMYVMCQTYHLTEPLLWQWEEIEKLIADKNFWSTIKVCVKVLESTVKVLRYSDGMRGGTLGLMYNFLLQLDELYSSPIEGLPDKVRTKVSPWCIRASHVWFTPALFCFGMSHTNLQLEHRLEVYDADMLPLDLEMTVEEPLSDDEDEDGVPHCVSDSESESENDSD